MLVEWINASRHFRLDKLNYVGFDESHFVNYNWPLMAPFSCIQVAFYLKEGRKGKGGEVLSRY